VHKRDDQPFGGSAAPAAVYFYSPDRSGEHPERHLAGYTGILQADAYAGFNKVYRSERKPGPIVEAGCWSHARRKFFELADIASTARGKTKPVISPLAFEAVQKIDAIFMLERSINGLTPRERLTARRSDIAPLVNDFISWMRQERAKLSRHNDVAKAMDYMLTRIAAFTRFLEDGRICMSNNAAERVLRGIALGRKSWLFVGSDRGGERAAVMFTLIQTCKLNDVDPQAWLADVLARIAEHKVSDLAALLPWNWKSARSMAAAA
jgi:transposase